MPVTLSSGDLEATFVPEAGMVGSSLKHRGEEVLGQRDGLEAYVAKRKTMGIPLLYPWANRLSRQRFTVCGRQVEIDPERAPVRLDENGLPMHGLLSAVPGWQAEHDASTLTARFAFAVHPALMEAFPFAHELQLDVALEDPTLRIAATVHNTGDTLLPIAFGFHPYLQLPGVERADWRVEIPVEQQLTLDERGLPTGERVPVSVPAGPLGDREFDDAYLAPAGPFVLEGGGRRIELAFEAGYPYAQVFAPPQTPLIAFEPMTAPTDALVTGECERLAPGERFRAVFSVTVR